MKRIPIIICIDVEPDDRSISPDVKQEWRGFEETYEFFMRLRPRLEAATGSPVRFSWFFRMDPQIARVYDSPSWVAGRYDRLIQHLKSAGDNLGLHLHPWRWDAGLRTWVQDFQNQQWVDHCLQVAFKAFEESIGTPCRSFRFGDRWMNNATLCLLERLGARFDLTLEPGQLGGELPEPFTGSLPDYTDIPQQPYRPSRSDFSKPGIDDCRAIWLIPVSAGSVYSPFVPLDRRPATRTWVITRGRAVSTGVITASPNPIEVDILAESGATNLSWTSQGATEVEVRVNAPDGDLFARTGPCGAWTTGKWVCNGMVFYLQDVSDDRPLTSDNTLATVKVSVTTRERETQGARAARGEWMTLNLAFDSMVFCRIMERLLAALESPYLTIVARTDIGIRPELRSNLKETFDYILSHSRAGQFSFETPSEMMEGKG
jgi:hypothetical protein